MQANVRIKVQQVPDKYFGCKMQTKLFMLCSNRYTRSCTLGLIGLIDALLYKHVKS